LNNRTDHPRAELPLIYRRAAQIIDGRGHSKGKVEQPDGSVCAVGALRIAGGYDVHNQLGELPYLAAKFLSARLWVAIGDTDPIERIAEWNDAPERTVQEVRAALLAAAEAVEADLRAAVVPVCLRTSDGALWELSSIPAHGEPRYVLAGCEMAPPSVFAEYGELIDSFGAVPMGGAA
jgi:hypothetical protein